MKLLETLESFLWTSKKPYTYIFGDARHFWAFLAIFVA